MVVKALLDTYGFGKTLYDEYNKRPTSTTSTYKDTVIKPTNIGPTKTNTYNPIKTPTRTLQQTTPQTQTPQTPQTPSYLTAPQTIPTQPQQQTLGDYFQGGFPGSYENAPQGLQQATQEGMRIYDQLEQTQGQQIFDQYQKTMGDIKFKELQTSGQFTNSSQIIQNIDKVKSTLSQRITDPNQISKNTGLPIETVNKILQGKAFQDLQFSGTPGLEMERFTQDYLGKISDISKDQQRGLEDIEINKQRLNEQLKSNTDEIKRNLEMEVSGRAKMGALTGQILSSGYMQGLQSIEENAQRTITDLTKQRDNQTADITKMKNRMLEDYNLNTQKIKQQYDRGVDNMRMEAVSLIQDYQNKYGIASTQFSESLSTLKSGILKEKLQLTDNYLKGMKDYQDIQYKYYDMLRDVNKDMNDIKMQDGQVIYTDEYGRKQITPVADYQSRTVMNEGGQSAQQYNMDGLLFKKGANSSSIGSNNQGIITFLGDTSKIGGSMGGVDIAGQYGQPIYAEKDGVVHGFGIDNSTGNKRVEVKSSDGIIVRYNHLSDNRGLTRGQKVDSKTVIGAMGNTGITRGKTGVHVDITAYQGKGSREGGSPISTLDGQLRAIYGDRVARMQQAQQAQGQTYSKTPDAIKEVTDLRKEFNNLPEIKDYKIIRSSHNKLLNNIDSITPAGDIATVFSYMKMLDPSSVVREGEFANAQNAAGVPDRIRNMYNKAMEGTLLSTQQRKDFKTSAENVIKSEREKYNEVLGSYKGYITLGGDPSYIGITENKTTTQPTTPQPTTPQQNIPQGRDEIFNALK